MHLISWYIIEEDIEDDPMNKQKDAPDLSRRRFLRLFLWMAVILVCGYASILMLYQNIGAPR